MAVLSLVKLYFLARHDDLVHSQSFLNHCPFLFYLQKNQAFKTTFVAMRALTPSIITVLFFTLVQLISAQSHINRNSHEKRFPSSLQRRHTTHLAKRFSGSFTFYAVGLGSCGSTNVPSDFVRLTLGFLALLLIFSNKDCCHEHSCRSPRFIQDSLLIRTPAIYQQLVFPGYHYHV